MTFPASGNVARVQQSNRFPYSVDGFVISTPSYGAVEFLPDSEDGVIYIVSNFVAQALPHRKDLVYPDSGSDAVRENGQIKYVRRFLRI